MDAKKHSSFAAKIKKSKKHEKYIQNYVSNNYCFNYQNFRSSLIRNR